MYPRISEVLEHSNVIGFAPRLLEDAAVSGDNDGVSCDDEVWVGNRGEVCLQGSGVNVKTFLSSGGSYVFPGTVGALVEIFGFGGRRDFEIGKPKLHAISMRICRTIIEAALPVVIMLFFVAMLMLGQRVWSLGASEWGDRAVEVRDEVTGFFEEACHVLRHPCRLLEDWSVLVRLPLCLRD